MFTASGIRAICIYKPGNKNVDKFCWLTQSKVSRIVLNLLISWTCLIFTFVRFLGLLIKTAMNQWKEKNESWFEATVNNFSNEIFPIRSRFVKIRKSKKKPNQTQETRSWNFVFMLMRLLSAEVVQVSLYFFKFLQKLVVFHLKH